MYMSPCGRHNDRLCVQNRVGIKNTLKNEYVPQNKNLYLAVFAVQNGEYFAVDHPPTSSAEAEGRVELYICSPSGPSWPVVG